MGLSHHVYVGAYLRITEPVTVTQVDRCADHDRGNYVFCPVCGYENHMIMRSDAATDDGFWGHDDWIDHLHAVITSEPDSGHREIVAKSNTRAGGMQVDRYTDEGEYGVPDMVAGRRKFLAEHQRDVDRLRALGCTVTIEFGILAWSS